MSVQFIFKHVPNALFDVSYCQKFEVMKIILEVDKQYINSKTRDGDPVLFTSINGISTTLNQLDKYGYDYSLRDRENNIILHFLSTNLQDVLNHKTAISLLTVENNSKEKPIYRFVNHLLPIEIGALLNKIPDIWYSLLYIKELNYYSTVASEVMANCVSLQKNEEEEYVIND